MWDDWVVDVTLYQGDNTLCFVPVENIETGSPTFVVSMNVISDLEHFDMGRVRGVIHANGDEAVDEFCNKNPQIVQAIKDKCILGEEDGRSNNSSS